MSTQTGICANSDLAAFFAGARQEKTKAKYRMIKVEISNEELILGDHREASGTWERDWESMVRGSVEADQPCYILFRTDELDGSNGYKWVLISWSPDSASVRFKMLYASTKATLKKDFGSGHISDDYYANTMEEVTLSGYKRHLASEKAPQPLTRAEEELNEVKASEHRTEISIETKHQTVGGIAFPLTKAAVASVTEFRVRPRESNYVQLAIDIEKEMVNVSRSEKELSIQELPSVVPTNVPRYHLYRYNHHHEGAEVSSIVFIYSMPGYECSIKERMLYSSCRNALVDQIGQLNITIDKKMEVDSGSELTEENIFNEIHPKKESNVSAKVTRPAPPSRGKRRMIKVPQ